jgi:hypothetical protein
MSYFSNLVRGRWRDETILTSEDGVNVAIVDVTGALKVTTTGGGGNLTAAAPTVAAVGVASATAVAALAGRKGLIVRNLSTAGQRISLGFSGNAAVLDSGATLYPQDAFNMASYDFTVGAVAAISSAAGASLGIQEYS